VVRDTFVCENIIRALHILLHADDTAVLSTESYLSGNATCSYMLISNSQEKSFIELEKSRFLVINASGELDIRVESGWLLLYASSYLYLRGIISDDGQILTDVELHSTEKSKS